ncbi:hypothetical protein [Emticicia aquatilis]|nr:hypothetical protein [Emticicia aquatilis]
MPKNKVTQPRSCATFENVSLVERSRNLRSRNQRIRLPANRTADAIEN